MRALLDWTLDAIREESSDFSWMEEKRYTWTPLIESALHRIMDGQTVLLLTDPRRRWFEHYILNAINDTNNDRPFLPIQSLHGVFSDVQGVDTNIKMTLMEDMLDITYPQGYFIWYIGEGGHPYTKLVYRKEDNFLWLINEEIAGSFLLRESDPLLDIKLLQLYRLFDKSVDAALYGQVELY
jgi:hypothetical protein